MRRIVHSVSRGAGVGVLALAVLLTTACEIESPTGDPNAVPEAELNQLFTADQVAVFFHQGSELSRLAAAWTQQVFGADRQFASLYQYTFGESDGDDVWRTTYRDGGLAEIRQAMALADEAGRPAYTGMLQIHEAYMMGMAASIWGAVPYTEAVNPEIQQPALDGQFAVYDAVQTLLSNAITNLETGEGAPAGGVDLNFNGDTDAWIAVAHSLKARFYMHVAEVQGNSAYQAAYNEAQLGIGSAANNWNSVHSTTSTENNLWYQFQRDRSGYIEPNSFMVTLLNDRADPRLDLYFIDVEEDSGNPGTFISPQFGLPIEQNYDQPIVSCAETQFIEAEAALALGLRPQAEAAYADGLACQEDLFGITLTDASAGLTDAEFLEEIMLQKYTALFLNAEVWNDYKRTCYPTLSVVGETPEGNSEVPPGLFYPGDERTTNPNIPAIGECIGDDCNTLRNPNDPNSC